MVKIHSKFGEHHCPKCGIEIYALNVSSFLEHGGWCSECGTVFDAGESLLWTSAEGHSCFSTEMDVQWISNILSFLETGVKHLQESDKPDDLGMRDGVIQAYGRSIKIFIDELKSRGEERLPYVPYYPKEIEDKIFGREE